MPKKVLTDKFVERVKPPSTGTTSYFDLGYPALALRVGKGGAKSWEQWYWLGVQQKHETFGRWPAMSLADARAHWRKTREALARGENPSPESLTKNPTLLFDHVVQEWLRRDQAEHKSFYQVTRTVESDLLPAWKGKPVNKISKKDVIALLDSIVDRGAPAMARKVQASVNRFFAWCLERDILVTDPTVGMSRVGSNVTRERVLSDDELKKVWRAADKIGLFGDVVRLLILTGARRETITQLRWSEIEGDKICLANGRSKNGQGFDIPLSAPARALLAKIPRIDGSEFVFTTNGRRPIQGWAQPKRKLDVASGVEGWVVHHLRRTCATGLQKLGVTLQVVESILGHKAGSRAGVVGIYQRHDFAAEKRDALELWGKFVTKLVKE